jgi:hypothetical protein
MQIVGIIPALFVLLVSGISLFQAVNGLRSGRLIGRNYDLSRAESPIGFWLMMAVLCTLAGVTGIAGAVILSGATIGGNH